MIWCPSSCPSTTPNLRYKPLGNGSHCGSFTSSHADAQKVQERRQQVPLGGGEASHGHTLGITPCRFQCLSGGSRLPLGLWLRARVPLPLLRWASTHKCRVLLTSRECNISVSASEDKYISPCKRPGLSWSWNAGRWPSGQA